MNIEEIYRRDYGRILASLIRVVRDFTLAEDSLQEAFAAAHVQWAGSGPPPNPVAWLLLTARHKAIDQIRRRALHERKLPEIESMIAPEETMPAPQDTLRLIFTCCHPALAAEARVALTLRTVCGLETEEIARAFVVPVATMAQRLVRAKNKIRLAGIPYKVPDDDQLAERIESALAVIYLVFNEGYAATSGEGLIRADLCHEAIRLARQFVALLPAEREPAGLLALMLFNDSRRTTRTDAAGDLVLLEDQDRARWNRARIEEATTLVDHALLGASPGPYGLQAAIGALHANAPTSAETDWRQIAELYGVLGRVRPSAVVELNRAVAVAMAEGLAQGLALLEQIRLPNYHWLAAARADLLRRLGRRAEAAAAYREALALVGNAAERRFLERRLGEVTGG
ncbi:MAG: RNA polymerase sigma factor [Burkholderiales bacterium]|nr:RNA polymerase sigma factor [Opitutaceae bacterium]